VFHPTPGRTDEDVAHVAEAVFRRVERRLAERESGAVQRRFVEGAPVLVAMAEASVGGVSRRCASRPPHSSRARRARGPRRFRDGAPVRRGRGVQSAGRDAHPPPVIARGWSEWRAISPAPLIATNRLSQLDDGRLELRLKPLVLPVHESIETVIFYVCCSTRRFRS
jgi:hypothetical protein